MPLAFLAGMKHRRPLYHSVWIFVLSILSATALGANTPVSVDAERGADDAYVVGASLDVDVPITWEVLTDYEGIGRSLRKLLDKVRPDILARAAR